MNHESLETHNSIQREFSTAQRQLFVEPGAGSQVGDKQRVTVVQRSRSPAKSIGKIIQGGRTELNSDHVSLRTFIAASSNVGAATQQTGGAPYNQKLRDSRNKIKYIHTDLNNTLNIQGGEESPVKETIENDQVIPTEPEEQRPKKRQVYRSNRELRYPDAEE